METSDIDLEAKILEADFSNPNNVKGAIEDFTQLMVEKFSKLSETNKHYVASELSKIYKYIQQNALDE